MDTGGGRAVKHARDVRKRKGDFLANGHSFGETMWCMSCQRSWKEHQREPRPCEAAVSRLERLLGRCEQLLAKGRRDLAEIQELL